VEGHLSDVDDREDVRWISVIGDLCVATVKGRGPDGYRDALVRLSQELA
jgi:3-dehydroquinate dehydratase-2